MSQRMLRGLKSVTVALGAGLLFGSLTCVQNVADVVGTGLSLTAASGVLGNDADAAANLGAGLDFLADLIRFSPFAN